MLLLASLAVVVYSLDPIVFAMRDLPATFINNILLSLLRSYVDPAARASRWRKAQFAPEPNRMHGIRN